MKDNGIAHSKAQVAKAAKIIAEGSKPVDPEVVLADQRNKLKKIVPEYQDAERFEAEREVLLARAVQDGLNEKQVAKLTAKDVKGLRDRVIRDAEQARLDRIVKAGRKAGKTPEQIGSELLRGGR